MKGGSATSIDGDEQKESRRIRGTPSDPAVAVRGGNSGQKLLATVISVSSVLSYLSNITPVVPGWGKPRPTTAHGPQYRKKPASPGSLDRDYSVSMFLSEEHVQALARCEYARLTGQSLATARTDFEIFFLHDLELVEANPEVLVEENSKRIEQGVRSVLGGTPAFLGVSNYHHWAIIALLPEAANSMVNIFYMNSAYGKGAEYYFGCKLVGLDLCQSITMQLMGCRATVQAEHLYMELTQQIENNCGAVSGFNIGGIAAWYSIRKKGGVFDSLEGFLANLEYNAILASKNNQGFESFVRSRFIEINSSSKEDEPDSSSFPNVVVSFHREVMNPEYYLVVQAQINRDKREVESNERKEWEAAQPKNYEQQLSLLRYYERLQDEQSKRKNNKDVAINTCSASFDTGEYAGENIDQEPKVSRSLESRSAQDSECIAIQAVMTKKEDVDGRVQSAINVRIKSIDKSNNQEFLKSLRILNNTQRDYKLSQTVIGRINELYLSIGEDVSHDDYIACIESRLKVLKEEGCETEEFFIALAKRGNRYYESKSYGLGRRYYEIILQYSYEKEGSNLLALEKLGDLYLAEGKFEEAAIYYNIWHSKLNGGSDEGRALHKLQLLELVVIKGAYDIKTQIINSIRISNDIIRTAELLHYFVELGDRFSKLKGIENAHEIYSEVIDAIDVTETKEPQIKAIRDAVFIKQANEIGIGEVDVRLAQPREVLREIRASTKRLTALPNKEKAAEYLNNKLCKLFKDIIKSSMLAVKIKPCRYAAVGLASIARRQLCPYSDLDMMIITERSIEADIELRRYFKGLIELIKLKIINLGETRSHGQLRGITFDSNGCFPSITEREVRLVGTAQELRKNDSNDVSVFQDVIFLGGDQELLETYKVEPVDKEAVMELMRHDLNSFRLSEDLPEGINVKERLLRFPTLHVSRLFMYHGFELGVIPKHQTINDAKIEQLVKAGLLTQIEGDGLKSWITFALNLRIKAHLHYGGEKEIVYTRANLDNGGYTLDHGELEELRYLHWHVMIPTFTRAGRLLLEQSAEARVHMMSTVRPLEDRVKEFETLYCDKFSTGFRSLNDIELMVELTKLHDGEILAACANEIKEFMMNTLPNYAGDYWLAFEASKIQDLAVIVAIISNGIKTQKLFPPHYKLDRKNMFNSKDHNGKRLLYMVAGNVQIVRVLVQGYKADINGRNNDGQTPVFAAVALGAIDSLRLLRKEGAELNNAQGLLHHTVKLHEPKTGRNLFKVAEYLVQVVGLSVIEKGNFTNTPLALARELGKADLEILFKERILTELDIYIESSMSRLSIAEHDIENDPKNVFEIYNSFSTFLRDCLRHIPDSKFVETLRGPVANMYGPVLKVQHKYLSKSKGGLGLSSPRNIGDIINATIAVNNLASTFLHQGFIVSDYAGAAGNNISDLERVRECLTKNIGFDVSIATTILQYYWDYMVKGKFIVAAHPMAYDLTREIRVSKINEIYGVISGEVRKLMLMNSDTKPEFLEKGQEKELIEALIRALGVMNIVIGKGSYKDFELKMKKLIKMIFIETEQVIGFIQHQTGLMRGQVINDRCEEILVTISKALEDQELPSYKEFTSFFMQLTIGKPEKLSWLSRLMSSHTQVISLG